MNANTLCRAIAIGCLISLSYVTPLFAQAADAMDESMQKDTKVNPEIDLNSNDFSHETRLGANLSTGNTDSFAISGKSNTVYRIKRFENKFDLGILYHHVSSVTNDDQTGTIAQYIFGFYRLDYYINERFTVYGGGGGYTDKIKGKDLGFETFTGLKYYFIRTEKHTLSSELGYDFTYEDFVDPDPNESTHSAHLGVFYSFIVNDHVKITNTLAANKSVTQSDDITLDNISEIKVSLSKIFAFIVSFDVRFDNKPATGFEKLDTLTDVAIAITF